MSFDSEEEIISEATPSMHAKLSQKSTEDDSAQSDHYQTNGSTSSRHAGITNPWLKWVFWLTIATPLFWVPSWLSVVYYAPVRSCSQRDPITWPFIYHTAFPRHITTRRDLLHDFSPHSESLASAQLDVYSISNWSCSGSGSLHLSNLPKHSFSYILDHPHHVIPDVLYCPNFPEPDHISAARWRNNGSGFEYVQSWDKELSQVLFVNLAEESHGQFPAVIDDRNRVRFEAYALAPASRLSRLVEWRKRLVDDPFWLFVGYRSELCGTEL